MSLNDSPSIEGSDPMRRLGRPGGDWQGVRPSFDNPLTWSIPLGRIAGIAIRVHVIFLLFAIVQLAKAVGEPSTGNVQPIGFGPMAVLLAVTFVLVLTHEFGHCLACRLVRGEANEILMWPLGGLAYCRPPNQWQAHLWTVIGGPLVNLALCAILIPLLGFQTGKWVEVALPNPLRLSGLAYVHGQWPLMVLYMMNWVSATLFLFNLLPIFPLDGGRIVQAVMWPRAGYSGSMRISLRTGYIGAIVLGVFGLFLQEPWLLGVAIFGGITCYITHKQLEWTDAALGFESPDEYPTSYEAFDDAPDPAPPSPADLKAQRAQKREQDDARELDRILSKISSAGMESLTEGERGFLRRMSERRRD